MIGHQHWHFKATLISILGNKDSLLFMLKSTDIQHCAFFVVLC